MKTMNALRSAMAEVDAYYKERGIFQDQFGFGASPALIVIDMGGGVYVGGENATVEGKTIDALGD